jgi:(1->4)-alpha-D-glucan 1-alpha-D-glucosylmutase
LTSDDAAGLETLRARVAGWQQKALREAKLRSSWSQPDEAYEAACQDVLARLLDPVRSAVFLKDLVGYVDEIAPAGALNGLTASALKCGVPGIPDFYQGSEFWDFSLVDPDNRRPVDFRARAEALAALARDDRAGLVRDWRDGRIKQAVIAEALDLRRRAPDVFAAGEHIPLSTSGPRANNLLAFVRRAGSQAVLLAAPLRCALAPRRGGGLLPSADWWGETRIDSLPQGLDLSPVRSDPRAGQDPGSGLLARDLFADWPVFWMSTAAPADARAS